MVSGWGEIPFSDRSVDVVLARDVDLQLKEWEASAFYREAWRVLRPGGWLVARNRAAGKLRSLDAFRRRLEREGHRFLGGEVECSFGADGWLKLLPAGAVEWALGRRFTVVAARY
ncbi:MAG: methyltransferase domain-containing protein [Acidobacteria bacterium]|nr:methyltransferase domain-containing protein [Acidobacteriota bacterium]